MEPTTPTVTAHRIGARTTIPVDDLIYTLPDALAALAQQLLDVMYTAQEEGGYTLHPETFDIHVLGNDTLKRNPDIKALEVTATLTATLPNKNRK